MFDDGLADVSVAQRVWHVGAGEIERPGARFRINEGGFLTTDGGEEPAALGVVADVELHGVTFPRFSARAPSGARAGGGNARGSQRALAL